MNEYGRALRRWRRLRSVKQSHAAELFGVTQATLSRWERGHHRLPDAAARKLSHLLAAPLDSAAGAAELRGVSLWGFATDEIRSAEARLGDLGWYDDGAVRVSFWTGANDSPIVRIDPGILVWERLQLGDGTLARLVTSTPAG
jgi:transcriptional regulator with XRE-family HTH domain